MLDANQMLKRARSRNLPHRNLTPEERVIVHQLVKEGRLVRFKWPYLVYYKIPDEN